MAETAADELPYTRHAITAEDEAAVVAALRAERIAQGPRVPAFEAALGRATGAPHVQVVPSGTLALELALEALGVGPGDEVIVPPLTFVATANAVCRRGATPVFADVTADTLNLDPASVAERVGARTVGAIAVHFAGHPADVEGLRAALGRGRFLLEDAAHALGATLDGRVTGSLGDAACFSFHPAKGVTCGEGGAIATADEALHERIARLADHGLVRCAERFQGLGLPERWAAEERGAWVYEQQGLGTNGRMSEPMAALGMSQLARLDAQLARRRELVRVYTALLESVPEVEPPTERRGVQSAWHLFPVRLRDGAPCERAELYRRLHRLGIGVQVHYVPLHLQPVHRERYGTRFGDCPVAEDAYLRMLSLPFFPTMSDDDPSRVVQALAASLRETR